MATEGYRTKSRFESNPAFLGLPGFGNKYVISLDELVYRWGPGPLDYHIVPAFKLTDLASVPWFAGIAGIEAEALRKQGLLGS